MGLSGGTASPFSYGDRDTDFCEVCQPGRRLAGPVPRGDAPQWHPKDGRFNDGAR